VPETVWTPVRIKTLNFVQTRTDGQSERFISSVSVFGAVRDSKIRSLVAIRNSSWGCQVCGQRNSGPDAQIV